MVAGPLSKLPPFFKGARRKEAMRQSVSISFKGVSRIFERSLKGVFRKFLWCLTNFQGSFKRVSIKFQGSRAFQRRLKGVSREISVGFKGI